MAKKVRGRLHYFGKWADDPKGKAAFQRWLDQKDDLLAGREPRAKIIPDGPTVADLCNSYLTYKKAALASQEITPRTFQEYYVVSVAEGTFCDFVKFRRLAFYGPTELGASRWARHAV